MRVPRPRLGGPVEQRDATVFLTVAAAMIVVRLPASFMALLLLPMAAVVVQGIRRHAPWPRGLRTLLLWCLLAAGTSVLFFHPDQLASPGNNFIIMLAIAAVAAAIFTGGRVVRATDRLVDGLYLGLLMVWALSIFEAVTGFKFMTVLYPDANTVKALQANRFYVAALFPNYNDYSVAMALLCTLLVARLLFRPVGVLQTCARLFVLATATFFILVMGSRGALVGVLAGAVLVAVLSVRVLHPRLFGIRLVVTAALLVTGLAVAVMQTPWFNDNSTAKRGIILGNISAMQSADPVSALLGWGSATSYKDAAALLYDKFLMDPHNVLAEIAVWYGIPALLGYLVVWFVVVLRRGLFQLQLDPTWRSIGVLSIALLMPVLGVVPASTLRYHIFWLWLVATSAYILDWRRQHRARPVQPARNLASTVTSSSIS